MVLSFNPENVNSLNSPVLELDCFEGADLLGAGHQLEPTAYIFLHL